MAPRSASNERREFPHSMNCIVSQWQDLASMDRQSPGFVSSLSSLTAEDNRSSTTHLPDVDARTALNIMDEIFRGGKIPGKCERNTLATMRRLAYNSRQIPTRYQINRDTLKVETTVIASGTFADVRKGSLGEKAIAIRTVRIDKKMDNDESQRLFCKECILWMNVSHPNLLQLIGVDINPQTGQCSTISGMMNGNITEYIHENAANRHHLLTDAAKGLDYLHRRHIIHGDLKGHNILITHDTPPRACLADFGLSTFTPENQGTTTTITAGGTPLYMAPELLAPQTFGGSSARPTKFADVYAFGMVIFEVLTGLQPFHERKWPSVELPYRVIGGERPAKPGDVEQVGLGGGTWKLVEECWRESPERRPTIERIHEHLRNVSASLAVVSPTTGTQPSESKFSDDGMQPFDSVMSGRRTRTMSMIFETISTRLSGLLTLHGKTTGSSPLLGSTNYTPSSSIGLDHDYVPAGHQNILSRWRDLRHLKSTDHLFEQLAPLVDIEENRAVALNFKGNHATVVINILDKVLKQKTEGRGETVSNSLQVLRKLAGETRQVPESYLVGRWTLFTVKRDIIARGGFADVREGRLWGNVVAVKTIQTSQEDDAGMVHKAFCKESVLWMNVSHPNILKLVAVDIRPPKMFSMVSEMMRNGNIMKYIRAERSDRLRLLKDVTNGLQHLHGLEIVHGDLKGRNILINNENPPRACISDFGLCAIAPGMSFDPTTYKDVGGTVSHMAPELFHKGAKRTKEADLYAFGIVVYEVITGAHAFGHAVSRLSDPYRLPERPANPVLQAFGEGTWEFVGRCWNKHSDQRPTALEGLQHFERVARTPKFVDPSPTLKTPGMDSGMSTAPANNLGR